jgi:hypothetical protein
VLAVAFLAAVAVAVAAQTGTQRARPSEGARLYAADGARGSAGRSGRVQAPQPFVGREVRHDTSPPLRDIPPITAHGRRKEHAEHPIPVPAGSGTPDPVVQSTVQGATAAPTVGPSFPGIPEQNSAPPDPNGAVGPTDYVQIVNEQFEVFSKTGTALYGPANTNTLWSGFGGGCQTNNDGDATVSYDRLADRWVIQQFSVSTTPYLECIAVSATGDPTGAWHRYAFGNFGSNFPDYPKLGVWPDAYYVTYNLFANGSFFVGPEACAYDRTQMLAGNAATQQCQPISNTNLGGLLPATVDSAAAPPTGSPEDVLAFDTGVLDLWRFHVDWTTPANTTLTGPISIPVAAFNPACGGGTCIPQPGTTNKLDSLGDRLMYRLAYRKFGDHESLVVGHAVTAGSTVGMRWYELRDPNGTPTVYQQGTYAPADGKYRWMGSVAMDGSGDIALGFSTSGASTGMFPSIAYTGRLAGDPLGTMTQGETVLTAGSGSQTGGLSRWGDYSSMAIDPSDDCTFWYTNEYLPSNGSFNWRTRIGSFSLPGCGGVAVNDFSISASPSSVSVLQGQSGATTIDTAVTSGSAQTVSLSASGLPSGATASFNPSSVNAGSSSQLTISVGASTTPGSYPITVTGTGTSATHTTTVNLTVTAPVTNDFSISASPSSLTLAQNTSGTSTISTAVTSGSAGTVSLSASGTPAGATASLSPTSVTAGSSSTLTVSAGTAAAGSYTITITGTEGSATHSTTVALTVTAPSTGAIVNGGFEAGNLSGWMPSGAYAAVVAGGCHGGSYCAQLGLSTPTSGDSSIAQTFTVPSGSTALSFWYQVSCPDTVQYDWATARLRDLNTGKTTTVLKKTCTNTGLWVQAGHSVTAGHRYTLTLTSHDDNYPGDATFTLFDDVALQ